MVKGACYVRVSTDNQLENYSIEEQTDRLQAYCRARDITITEFYTDGGYSGGSINRPALQQMLKDIRSGEINLVIVYKLDRLSRSQKDTLTLIEDHFLANHVDFISVSENFDTSTPFGRAMIGILSVFAQLEKEQITERFMMGKIGRAKNGLFHGGGYAPTGYDYIDGKLIINEYEALQIRELYERFAEGCSIHSCWKYMQAHYTTKYGAWKSETLVRNILRNRLYTGYITFNHKTYKGIHEPIVSEELFCRVQDIFRHIGKDGDSHKHFPFRASTLLSGLVYCGKCWARYHGEHGNYSCYSRTKADSRYVTDPECRNKKWKIGELNSAVIDCITCLHFEETRSDPMVRIPPPKDYSRRLAQIERQISRLIELCQLENIPVPAASEKLDALAAEKNALLAASRKLSDQSANPPKPIKFCDRLTCLLNNGTLEEKRDCLSHIIDKIVVNDDDIQVILK